VTKRPDQNWTVVAGRYALHVIGTRFTVSYSEGNLGVWVDEGRVAVSVPQRGEPLLLAMVDHLQTEGEKLTLEVHHDGDDHPSPSSDMTEDNVSGNDPSAALEPPHPEAQDTESRGQAGSSTNARVRGAAGPTWRELYNGGHYAEALREAKRLGFAKLTQTLGASKLVELADTARLGGDSDAALEALGALEARFVSVATAHDSDFLVARLHTQRGETSSAIRRLTKYLERGDGSRYGPEALGRLVELHSQRGNKEQARSLARRYLERAPNGPYHRYAESVLRQK
jgi:hypothetical protein